MCQGAFEICKLILQHIVDKNPPNKLGITPLDKAQRGGHQDVANLLKKVIQETQEKK